MLKFIGIGSAFNTDLGNTSAYIKKENRMLLIDCGGTVFHEIQKQKLLEDVNHIYIIITHTHPDHVGSVGEVIFHFYYLLGKKATIIYPHKEHITKFLESVGVSGEMYELLAINDENQKIYIQDQYLSEIGIRHIPVTHVDTIEAYGFILKIQGKTLYYSGDANQLSTEVIQGLKNGQIDVIYHDTCGLDYEKNSHMSLKKLKEMIEEPYRNKVYCMHLDKHITKAEILKEGFRIVERYKEMDQ